MTTTTTTTSNRMVRCCNLSVVVVVVVVASWWWWWLVVVVGGGGGVGGVVVFVDGTAYLTWCLDKLQKEVRQPLPQAAERGLAAAAVEHLGFPVTELHNVPRERAIEVLGRPLGVEEHIQPLVDGEARVVQPLV